MRAKTARRGFPIPIDLAIARKVWHFYLGAPMTVVEMDASAPGHARTTVLGQDIFAGQSVQYTVRAGTWFGSFPNDGGAYSFVGCTVAPGFDFVDFEMADPADLKREFPDAHALIEKLTIGL